MKRILCLALCLSLLMGLTACHKTETPDSIMASCGLNVDVAPADAKDITYRTMELDTGGEPLLAAEAAFTLNDIQYRYRVAPYAPTEPDAQYDLSQLEIPGAVTETATVIWCDATLIYSPGGAGKIIWYDIVPGLLYSLDMNQGASAEALLTMAETLYTPAQGDVG